MLNWALPNNDKKRSQIWKEMRSHQNFEGTLSTYHPLDSPNRFEKLHLHMEGFVFSSSITITRPRVACGHCVKNWPQVRLPTQLKRRHLKTCSLLCQGHSGWEQVLKLSVYGPLWYFLHSITSGAYWPEVRYDNMPIANLISFPLIISSPHNFQDRGEWGKSARVDKMATPSTRESTKPTGSKKVSYDCLSRQA